MSAEERTKLNSIFKECDVENAAGENKPDGELSAKERNNFLTKIESALPKLFKKLLDFSTIVELKEDLKAKENQEKKV